MIQEDKFFLLEKINNFINALKKYLFLHILYHILTNKFIKRLKLSLSRSIIYIRHKSIFPAINNNIETQLVHTLSPKLRQAVFHNHLGWKKNSSLRSNTLHECPPPPPPPPINTSSARLEMGEKKRLNLKV